MVDVRGSHRRLRSDHDQRERSAADTEEAFLDHPRGKVLNSMCGFGPCTGARTLAEIDPHRFANPGPLAA
ncbi:MAG: hypothetical protein OXM88_10425 [bacterium]|nr:hypothetical protein [bacterium]